MKISMTLLEGIRRMKKNCMPLCKPLSNGDITSLGKKRSSLLTISPYSSPRPSRNYKQLDNSSGLITYNNFNGQIKYRKGKANVAVDCLSRPPITLFSTVMSMQGYDTTTWP